VFVLVIGTPAAYSLARFEFKGVKSRDVTLWFLSQRVLPPVVVLTPVYILLAETGLIDTWFGLILLYVTFNMSFCVVIMRDIFRDLSRKVEEAAIIEGASLWQAFWMIALTLSLDGLVVTAFIVFAFCWNEALFASAVTTQQAVTIPVFVLASRDFSGYSGGQAQFCGGEHYLGDFASGDFIAVSSAVFSARVVVWGGEGLRSSCARG
jgi:multiple sugar transport system permease protein